MIRNKTMFFIRQMTPEAGWRRNCSRKRLVVGTSVRVPGWKVKGKDDKDLNKNRGSGGTGYKQVR